MSIEGQQNSSRTLVGEHPLSYDNDTSTSPWLPSSPKLWTRLTSLRGKEVGRVIKELIYINA